jgi:hypothetical protein
VNDPLARNSTTINGVNVKGELAGLAAVELEQRRC